MSGVVRLIRMKELVVIVGLSRSTIYDLIAKGKFPSPVKIGRVSAWKSTVIQSWIDAEDLL